MPTVSRGIKIRLHESKSRATYGVKIKRCKPFEGEEDCILPPRNYSDNSVSCFWTRLSQFLAGLSIYFTLYPAIF